MTSNPNWQSNMDFEPSVESTKIALAILGYNQLPNAPTVAALARLIDHLNGTVPEDADRIAAIEIVCGEGLGRTDNQLAAIRSGQAGAEKVALVMAGIKYGRASK